MSFLAIAEPFIKLGIPVFPLSPKTKVPPSGLRFLTEATTDQAQVVSWNADNLAYNVALLANDEFGFLEFDIKGGMKAAANEAGEAIPLTRAQRSGKGFGHYIFKHTERSRKLGNRSVNLTQSCDCDREENRPCLRPECKVWTPHHHHEWFSFRASNKYLVGAGMYSPQWRPVHNCA